MKKTYQLSLFIILVSLVFTVTHAGEHKHTSKSQFASENQNDISPQKKTGNATATLQAGANVPAADLNQPEHERNHPFVATLTEFLGVWLFPEYYIKFSPPKTSPFPNMDKFDPIPLDTIPEDDFLILPYHASSVVISRTSYVRMQELRSLNGRTLNGKNVNKGDKPYFVLSLTSPFLGCYLKPLPAKPPKWPGGFFDPCFNLAFDYAGRAVDASTFLGWSKNDNKIPDMESLHYTIDQRNNTLIIYPKK